MNENEKLIFNMLENINTNIGDLKTHYTDVKSSLDELKGNTIKYHTIVDNLRNGDIKLKEQLDEVIKNGFRIDNVEKRVDRLSNVAKHGYIMGIATTIFVGGIAFLAKTSNFLSRVIN